MASAALPILSLTDDPQRLADELGASFRSFGFAMIEDHGIDPALIARGWALTVQFFALPEEEKRRYHIAGLAGARGYTPFGIEKAKDAKVSDLKEFWHVGREQPAAAALEPNVWPERPGGFREVFSRLYAEFDRVGALLLSRIALHLELSTDWFEPAIEGGNSVLRLLHYPPVADDRGDAIRAAAHEDINLITLLLGAEEAGLELLGRDGRWLAVEPPPGALVVNIGDMLQRLTNHVLPSTTHRVRNPESARSAFGRYAMPYFLHPRSDFAISMLPHCVTDENPGRYPQPITAGAFLRQRLREIALL